jgi:hypothetical protein
VGPRGRVTIGLITWLVGLTLGSVSATQQDSLSRDPVPGAAGPREAGYEMLAADFHVHSFPGDGALLPWQAAAEARRRGLDAIALTNHNHGLQWRLARIASGWMPSHVIVLRGEEVTAPGFHIAAVGIDDLVRPARSPRTVIDAVHAHGGVAIAAHPGRRYGDAYDADALGALDGVEAAHPLVDRDQVKRQEIETFYARARAVNPSIAAIGSSDFHREAPIGSNRTFVFVTERTAAGVLDAVREGRTAACSAGGALTGGEPWVSMAAPACRVAAARAVRSPARSGGVLNAAAVLLALAGLVLTIWGTGRTPSVRPAPHRAGRR